MYAVGVIGLCRWHCINSTIHIFEKKNGKNIYICQANEDKVRITFNPARSKMLRDNAVPCSIAPIYLNDKMVDNKTNV